MLELNESESNLNVVSAMFSSQGYSRGVVQ